MSTTVKQRKKATVRLVDPLGTKSVSLTAQFAAWLGTLMREGLILNERMEIPVPKRQFFLNGIVRSNDEECTMLMSHSVSLPLCPTYIVSSTFKFYTGTKNWNLRMHEDDEFHTIATFANIIDDEVKPEPQETVLYLGNSDDLEIIDDEILQIDNTFTLPSDNKSNNVSDMVLLDEPVCNVVCAKKVRFDYSSAADHPVYTLASPTAVPTDSEASKISNNIETKPRDVKVPSGVRADHLAVHDLTNYPIDIVTTNDMIMNEKRGITPILKKEETSTNRQTDVKHNLVRQPLFTGDQRTDQFVPMNRQNYAAQNFSNMPKSPAEQTMNYTIAPKREFISEGKSDSAANILGYEHVYTELIPAFRNPYVLNQLRHIPGFEKYFTGETYEPIALTDVSLLSIETVLPEIDNPTAELQNVLAILTEILRKHNVNSNIRSNRNYFSVPDSKEQLLYRLKENSTIRYDSTKQILQIDEYAVPARNNTLRGLFQLARIVKV